MAVCAQPGIPFWKAGQIPNPSEEKNIFNVEENNRLAAIAADSRYARLTNGSMVEYCSKVFARHIRRGRVLELGPAEGVMTPHLAGLADQLTLVDGAGVFCERLQQNYPRAEVVHSLFEEFKPKDVFDSIVLGHVLEHVDDPVAILSLVKHWLAPGGRVFAAVPNSRSLHRQAAVIMGLLPFEEALNEADLHHGHRRVFNPETFRGAFVQSGLRIEVFGGFWLKPVSNAQVEASWTPAMLSAFMQLGERYPDIAAEIYVVAGRPATP
jgi:2-polyprenyl-3-methyl-5-hydroxy-6-metoxy-1,4-benzoquinol methylase